jgi:hypothetical protein
MQPPPRHQRGQPLHELQRAHDQVRRSVAPRYLELELHLPNGIVLHPLVAEHRSGDVAAQLFQPLALVCFDADRGVQTEAVDVGAQGLRCCGLARHHTRAAGQRESFLQLFGGGKRVRGRFDQGSDGLLFKALAWTCRARAGAAGAQDASYLAAPQATASRQIVGDALWLLDARGRVRLRFDSLYLR